MKNPSPQIRILINFKKESPEGKINSCEFLIGIKSELNANIYISLYNFLTPTVFTLADTKVKIQNCTRLQGYFCKVCTK